MEEGERQRPPRPRRQPEVVRASIEVGLFAVLVIVLLAVIGVVLHAGRGESAPPPNTVVVTQSADFATLDPALAQTADAWELEYATCAKLLNYPPHSGYRGTRLMPEVAASLPAVSADRLSYTFRVRTGWRFREGSPVTAASFGRALERAQSPELVSPAFNYLREVAWWRVHGRALTIHLRRVAPDFVQRLALPYFCAVPTWAPNVQRDDLPSAGPFFIAQYNRGRSLLLKRNPYYHGPRREHAQAILYRFGAFPSQIRLQLERGEADYGVVPPQEFAALIVAQSLKAIGLHVDVETSPGSSQLTMAAVRGTKFDITDVITRPDYGDPYALVDKLLDSRAIRSVGNTNLSYFVSPRLNRAIDAAQRLTGIARDRAYGRLGLQVARTEAPLAAYAVLNARVFLSQRVGCITYQAVYGLDLAGLCVR